MKEKKQDRRVRYSKMVIKESFVKILKDKPINKISIKEICEDADINRATFYAHYSDQYDLLRRIESEIIDDVNRYLDQYAVNDLRKVPVEMIERILEYVEENSELFDILLGFNGDMNFQREVIKIIGEKHFIPIMGEQYPGGGNAEYAFHFFASGAVGIIQKWVAEGIKKPAKEIAGIIMGISSGQEK